MLPPDPARGLVSDADRLTALGGFLRATSLDELPSLVNVLRGEMSLVGPRPLRTRYLARFSEEQARRRDVLPGLTGLAQVSGRNNLSWDDRFELDLHYVRTRGGPLKDLRILLATVPKVFRREGIAEDGQVTMRDFFGPRRIGSMALEPAPEGSGGEWNIVHRRTGVSARASLVPEGEDTLGILLDIDPRASNRDEIRAHAVEMLLGVAREAGAAAVRLAAARDDEILFGRLGFCLEPVASGRVEPSLVCRLSGAAA